MKEFVEKLPYSAPNLKVVPFKVERGFENSNDFAIQVNPTDPSYVEMLMHTVGTGAANGARNAQSQFGYYDWNGNSVSGGNQFGDTFWGE